MMNVEARSQDAQLKIFPSNQKDLRSLQRYLNAHKINLHTFALSEEREVKVVLE